MRAVVITKHGPPEVLQVQERPAPERPLGGEVSIEVAAAGINFADTMARIGLYPDAPKPPCVVGYEVAGTVAAVGPGVEGLAEGDRVMAGTQFGGYSERVTVKAPDVVPLPDQLSFEEGAAIPVNYSTAWAALVRYGSLQPGERVLIHAAAGGVGIAATQIAQADRRRDPRHRLARPSTTRSAPRASSTRSTTAPTAGSASLPRFDVILDAVGGRSFRTSYEHLRAGGRLVCFGASAVSPGESRNLLAAARTALRMPRFNLIKQMSQSKAVIGLNMLTLWKEAGTLDPWIEPLRELIDDGTIRPVVAEAFPFDRAPDAHRMLAERRNVGKVVLTP